MTFRNLFAAMAVTLILGVTPGCEKDQKTILTDGTWTFQNLTTDSEDKTTQDLVFLARALMTESTMEFSGDGTYLQDSPLMDEPTTGSWSLIGDDQLILTPEGEIATTANIEVLSKTELTYIETYMDLSQNPYTITTSWTRK